MSDFKNRLAGKFGKMKTVLTLQRKSVMLKLVFFLLTTTVPLFSADWSCLRELSYGDIITCEGSYEGHIQGMDTDGTNIYWVFASTLVKTDQYGKVSKSVSALWHQGDPCWVEGKLYVPHCKGPFNREIGNAESKNYVHVYDADLNFLREYHIPDLIYGAGCMAFCEGHFFIAGGLPDKCEENTVFEYDREFRLVKKHRIRLPVKSRMGIQTIKFAFGSWWLGCYGGPRGEFSVRLDRNFQPLAVYPYRMSYGLIPLEESGDAPTFLLAYPVYEAKSQLNYAIAVALKILPREL